MDHAGQRLERHEGHEHTALVGADAGAAEPAKDGVRLAEDQELRAQRGIAFGAQDHVAGLQAAIDPLGEPRLDREVARRIEADQVDRIVMAADARMLDPHDLLGGEPSHAGQVRLGQRIGIEHELGRLDDEQGGGNVGERAFGHHHHVGAQAGEADRQAAVDALHQGRAGEDDGAADGDGSDQQQAAGLAASEILEGEAQQQPAHPPNLTSHELPARSKRAHHRVHERVCFMCSSLVGTITQSWCPPLLGRMPIKVSVEVSMIEMPLDWRWKPLNGVSTYLPS